MKPPCNRAEDGWSGRRIVAGTHRQGPPVMRLVAGSRHAQAVVLVTAVDTDGKGQFPIVKEA